jgi:hypothetical protein
LYAKLFHLKRLNDYTGAIMTTQFKVIFSVAVTLIVVIIPTIAAELTYKEYASETETWRRGYLLGIAQYLSAVAQPDEEPPYPVRSAYQRCLSGARDRTLVRHMDTYIARNVPSSAEPMIRIALRAFFELCRLEIEKAQSPKRSPSR